MSVKLEEKFISETFKYFSKRGWENYNLFSFDDNFDFILNIDFFSRSNNKKECNWYVETEIHEFIHYCIWFLEHVKPFWLKYKIETKVITFVGGYKNPIKCIIVNEECNIIEII